MDETENPTGKAADEDEGSEMPLCAVDAQATLMVLSHGTIMVGRMTELGLGGCRILLPKALSNAVYAAIECTFKIRGVAFRLGGIVEKAENNLAGVRFNTMSSRSCNDLAEVLCEVELENNAKLPAPANSAVETAAIELPSIIPILAETAARNRSRPGPNAEGWNPFAGMAMGGSEGRAPDLKPGAAEPRKSWGLAVPGPARSTASVFYPAAAAAAAPAPQKPAAPVQSATQATKGRDRRASHRCGVDTSAMIDLVKVGSKIPGHIVDLSVGGCRIKTVDKFPVGIYTRIETEFKLHGLPFRLGGVIQAIHDRTTVGIRFLDMSQRKKDQVAELVAEMEESTGSQ